MAYVPLVNLVPQFFDNLGDPLAGGTLSAYVAGTSTPTNMFSDNAGTVAGTSVTLDSRGEPTTIKLIWLDTAVNYKFILKDSSNTTIWTEDNIVPDALVDGSVTTAKLANGAVTTAKLEGNSVTTAKIVDSNVTTAKIADSNVTTAKIADASVTPVKLSQPMTKTAIVTLASQTSVDFTSIPSWVKKITITLNFLLSTSANPVIMRIGTSNSGIISSGYGYGYRNVFSASPTPSITTTEYGIIPDTISSIQWTCTIKLALHTSSPQSWVESSISASDTHVLAFSSGLKFLPASEPLDRIRITTASGSGIFSNGYMSLIYEG